MFKKCARFASVRGFNDHVGIVSIDRVQGLKCSTCKSERQTNVSVSRAMLISPTYRTYLLANVGKQEGFRNLGVCFTWTGQIIH